MAARGALASEAGRLMPIDGCAAAWGAGTGQSRPGIKRPAATTTLYIRDQSGFREADASDVLDRAQALIAQRYRAGSPVLTSPERTREFLRMHLGTYDRETFGVLHLDNRHRLIAARAGSRRR
jgi:hypothetical protein